MADAMVTARMARGKKNAGNAALEALGTNASAAINDLYDYVIANNRLPFPTHSKPGVTPEALASAIAFIDSLSIESDSAFFAKDDDTLRQEHLISRGLAQPEDFL